MQALYKTIKHLSSTGFHFEADEIHIPSPDQEQCGRRMKLTWRVIRAYSLNQSLASYANLPVSRWCNTRQTEDRYWVSIVTWRRRQFVWRRSACTLCPASPSTTRTVVARLAARPKPQVGTAVSLSPCVHLLNSPAPAQSGQILSVISALTLQPTHPTQASPSPPSTWFLFPDLRTE